MMRTRTQAAAIILIGVADLITTLILVQRYGAGEANPLMAAALKAGMAVFIQVKLLLLILPLAVIEWARRRRPVFVRRALNVCICAYLGIYAAGVLHANQPRKPDPWIQSPITSRDIALARANLLKESAGPDRQSLRSQ